MSLLLPYTTALILGSLHALEADHMAAVTAFAVRKPAPLAAAVFGLRWAAGHGAAVIAAGALLLFVGLSLPESASLWLDRSVGLVLIGLGLWTAWHASHLHVHRHHHSGGVDHAHLHSHAFREAHDHAHAATVIGTMHGLAGAAPALALLQIARTDSLLQGMAYLGTFALGTALGMGLYALATGWLMGRAAVRSERWARWLGKVTGISTILIGIIWLLR
ncbi:MAG TPA: sulfite exporter TauE/SafE family protein [Longimicrobiales bacterium]|nr:sulfite exporter TauE/SafE family protein [Longimicrobiales bacterium]